MSPCHAMEDNLLSRLSVSDASPLADYTRWYGYLSNMQLWKSIFYAYHLYNKGSISISTTETGRTISKLFKTEGWSIPSEPMTMSLLVSDSLPGKTALRLSTSDFIGPSSDLGVGVGPVVSIDGRGR